jgi:Protein of unknown function (DUF1573)
MTVHPSSVSHLSRFSAIFVPLFSLLFALPMKETVFPAAAPTKGIAWEGEKRHNFGDIQHERPVRHRFAFKNNFSDTIRLETVRTTCGCTAAKWTESPIAPGQAGEVMIEYDAYKRGGFKKKIRVFFDKQRKPELLYITGNVD